MVASLAPSIDVNVVCFHHRDCFKCSHVDCAIILTARNNSEKTHIVRVRVGEGVGIDIENMKYPRHT